MADITMSTDRWWKHGGTDNYVLNNTSWDSASSAYIGNMGTQKGRHQLNGTITEEHSYSVAHSYSYDTADQYMRQREVSFVAKGLTPVASGYTMSFNGANVSIKPAQGYSTDNTGNNTYATDSTGSLAGSFTVPANVPCGTVEAIVTNGKDVAVNTYTASGITHHSGTYYTTESYFTTSTVSVIVADPVGETFQLQQDAYITSFNIRFGSKDDTEPVKFQIRAVDSAGNITNTVYNDTVTLTPDMIKTSNDGSVITNIKLPTPFLANANVQYSFVLASQSDNYTVFRAKLGEKLMGATSSKNGALDLSTICNAQPYGAGVMFTSSNNTSWVAEHDSDLAFDILVAKFNPTATVVFDVMKNVKMDTLVLFATYLTPNNTDCTWYYRMLDSNDSEDTDITTKDWLPLSTFETTELGSIVTQLQLKATFSAKDFSSPVIDMASLSLGQFLSAVKGDYIGRTIDAKQAPYNAIHLKYSAQLPENTSVTPYYSTDGGATWKQFTVEPTTITQNNNYTQYSYDEKLASMASSFKIKLHLETQTSFRKPYVTNLMTVFNQE